MTRFVTLMVFGLICVTGPAFAGCGESDNPMASSEGFGVATCAEHAPRYDAPAYRNYRVASSEDPMVWSGDQWRTSFFDYNTVTNGAYDRRGYETAPAPVRVEIERRVLVTEDEPAVLLAPPRGPKLINAHTRREVKARPGVLAFEGHKCRGALVLTWGEPARCKAVRRFQMLRGG